MHEPQFHAHILFVSEKKPPGERKQIYHSSQALTMLRDHITPKIIASMEYLCALIIGKHSIL